LDVSTTTERAVSHHSAEQERDANRKFVARISQADRERIAYLRNVRGLSTYAVARMAHVSHATVSRIAREIPEPDATLIRALHDPEVLALAAAEDDTP
jgi:DNA-binding transcriptional regulator YiaG